MSTATLRSRCVINFVDGAGRGVPERVRCDRGTTLKEFLGEFSTRKSVKNLVVKVNRQTVNLNTVLKNNDRVTLTPKNVKGA